MSSAAQTRTTIPAAAPAEEIAAIKIARATAIAGKRGSSPLTTTACQLLQASDGAAPDRSRAAAQPPASLVMRTEADMD